MSGMGLVLILAESAVELVPPELVKHPSVSKLAEKRGKKPGEILLDRSYHHAAMRSLKDAERRGRPDIVHTTLLELLGTPLNREDLLQTYVHTVDNRVVEIDSNVRLPVNYDRFVGLLEQLYAVGRVPETSEPLLAIRKQTLNQLLGEIKPSTTVAFTTLGEYKYLGRLCEELAKERKPAILIGGFPRGHFSKETLDLADMAVRIDKEALEAWVVASRAVYAYELAIGLPKQRLR
jgi:rRNA small subunit pseudouridine methyltransferase Nep1